MNNLLIEQQSIKDLPEFDKHVFVSFIYDHKTGMEGFIVIHRKNPLLPSFGATRLWHYDSHTDALKDALRLSKMMSYKAALAGLKCGGAKAVIMQPKELKDHKPFLRAYAERMNFIKDQFVTGTDVGLTQKDLSIMKEETSNIVGFNDNSTEFTALGLYYSIKRCLGEVFEDEEIQGRTFAIQGLGKVGSELLKLIYKDARKIYVSDIDSERVKEIKRQYPNVVSVQPEDIHKQKVDIFSPCALSQSLNSHSINELKCSIIVGGANNQLEHEGIGSLLYKLGILYAPDYVVNAGGLIAIFDEYEHKQYDKKRVGEKVMRIKNVLSKILIESDKKRKATNLIANEMAEQVFSKYE